jgi:hypothetical protein
VCTDATLETDDAEPPPLLTSAGGPSPRSDCRDARRDGGRLSCPVGLTLRSLTRDAKDVNDAMEALS